MTDSDTSVKSTASETVPVISAPIPQSPSQALHFPSLFNDSFGPSALLYAAPTLTTTMTYSEAYAPLDFSTNDRSLLMRSSSMTTVPATVTGLPPSISFAVLQLLSTSLLHILPTTQIPIPALKTHTISPLLPVQKLCPLQASNKSETSCFPSTRPTISTSYNFLFPILLPFPSTSNTRPICPVHQTLDVRPPFLAPHLLLQMTSQFQTKPSWTTKMTSTITLLRLLPPEGLLFKNCAYIRSGQP